MLTRYVVICFVVALAAIVIIARVYEHVSGVGVMRSTSKSVRAKTESKRRPIARASIIGAGLESGGSHIVVPIYSLNDTYASVGVSPSDFSRWQEKYGFGNLGRTDTGVLFVPNNPVLSKIAWMGIDPIELSSAETSELIEECAKARSKGVNAAANAELEALVNVAQKAIALGGAVRFDLP